MEEIDSITNMEWVRLWIQVNCWKNMHHANVPIVETTKQEVNLIGLTSSQKKSTS